MAINKFVTQTYPVECKGRDPSGREILSEPLKVKVIITKSSGSNMISSEVECPYNTGGHGQRCKMGGKDVVCPYSFDIPYAPKTKR